MKIIDIITSGLLLIFPPKKFRKFPVLSHSSAHLMVLILMLIVTFNTRSYCVLLRFTYSHGIALEA